MPRDIAGFLIGNAIFAVIILFRAMMVYKAGFYAYLQMHDSIDAIVKRTGMSKEMAINRARNCFAGRNPMKGFIFNMTLWRYDKILKTFNEEIERAIMVNGKE